MQLISMCKVGQWFVRLDSFTDEETWPDWLRRLLSIAAVGFIFLSILALLYVTP